LASDNRFVSVGAVRAPLGGLFQSVGCRHVARARAGRRSVPKNIARTRRVAPPAVRRARGVFSSSILQGGAANPQAAPAQTVRGSDWHARARWRPDQSRSPVPYPVIHSPWKGRMSGFRLPARGGAGTDRLDGHESLQLRARAGRLPAFLSGTRLPAPRRSSFSLARGFCCAPDCPISRAALAVFGAGLDHGEPLARRSLHK